MTEGPHYERKQGGDAKRRAVEEEQRCREQTQEEEKKTFDFDPRRVSQVFHVRRQ
jgi:hypothetical protein